MRRIVEPARGLDGEDGDAIAHRKCQPRRLGYDLVSIRVVPERMLRNGAHEQSQKTGVYTARRLLRLVRHGSAPRYPLPAPTIGRYCSVPP